MTEWIEEQKLRAELGGVVGVTRAVATGLLVAGAKSFTHMITFVERYGTVLDGLLREAGPPVSYLKCACLYKVLRPGALADNCAYVAGACWANILAQDWWTA